MLRLFYAYKDRLLLACCMVFFLICTCCSYVYAAPGDQAPAIPELSEKWVDLQAKVPTGFNGSV